MMKHMKKFLSLLLALVLLAALSPAAYATVTPPVTPPAGNGTIKIKNAVTGQTYTIYQILVLESYDADRGAYSYKAADDWKDFLTRADIKDTYVSVSDDDHVTWVKDAEGVKADAAAFARLARKYAVTNSIANQGSTVATGATVQFDNLPLGYYLVDSSLGALCSLDTTNPDVTIKDKNEKPTVEKTVQEDSTGNYGGENDASVGQDVNFKTVIHTQESAENFVLHDQMSAALTLYPDSIAVAGAEKDTDYTVSTESLPDGCTFEIAFSQDYLDKITGDTDITVSYRAALNDQAVIGGVGNPNDTKLDYGDANTTQWVSTVTYAWEMGILKYGGDDETKVLADAQFVLLNENRRKAAVLSGDKITGWADVPAAGASWPTGTVLTTDENGEIAIQGLDADTYYLRELQAPRGYNRLEKDTPVTVSAKTDETTGSMVQIPVTAKISNKIGSKLPTTGGIGTTIFYIVGTVLLFGAAILLILQKKRK